MPKDRAGEVDTQMTDTLPNEIDEVSQETVADQKQQEMINILKRAKMELGRSPSLEEFQSLNFEISGYLIKQSFGTWNDAKRAAGLETYEHGEGGHARTEINEEYFKNIDNPQKAYWLGTLVATSCIRQEGNSTTLIISRVNKPFFVKDFSDAVESEYSISEHKVTQNGVIKTDFQIHIQNSTFIEHLKTAGYPDRGQNSDEIPEIKTHFRAPFTRGYLESSGYFRTSGWEIPVNTKKSAERLQAWFNTFGAKRPTIGKRSGRPAVRVANVFDIKSVFETCWFNGVSTEPSYPPYPRKILDYLNSEYPYPENVDYLENKK